jgi:hypothetical protein
MEPEDSMEIGAEFARGTAQRSARRIRQLVGCVWHTTLHI